MGMTYHVVENVSFTLKSSNYDGKGRWGTFRLDVKGEDGEPEVSVCLERDEMLKLAQALIEASNEVVE
jgi:hypothetical protein